MSLEDGRFGMGNNATVINEAGKKGQWAGDTEIDYKLCKKKKKIKKLKKRLKNSWSVSKSDKKKLKRLQKECGKLQRKKIEKEQKLKSQMQEMQYGYQNKLLQAETKLMQANMKAEFLQMMFRELYRTQVGGRKTSAVALPDFLEGENKYE